MLNKGRIFMQKVRREEKLAEEGMKHTKIVKWDKCKLRGTRKGRENAIRR